MDIHEVLEQDGAVENIRVGHNLFFPQVGDPTNNDMALIMNNGWLALSPRDNPNKVWLSLNSSDFDITTSPTKLMEVTIDENVEAAKSTYLFAAMVTNGVDAPSWLRVSIKVNGATIGEETIQLLGLESNKIVSFASAIQIDFPANTKFEIFVYEQGGNLAFNGTMFSSTFKIEKQVALATSDNVGYTSLDTSPTRRKVIPITAVSNRLKRAEIVSALAAIGVTTLKTGTSIFKDDVRNKVWLVYYCEDSDEFRYTKLSKAL